MNDRKKKLMIIVALIAVVGVSIGFAAFSSSLLIKSSLSVDPNASDFRVVFSTSDSEEVTDAVIPTKDPTTIIATSGTIDNSVTPTISDISATFTEPGQSVVYNLYAYNAGKYEAYLNSVTLKGNKSCTPGEGTSIQLAGQACEAISVTVKVGNDSYNKTTTGITGKSIEIGESTPIQITLSYSSTGARADGPFEVEFSDISLYYATVSGQDEEYIGESGTLYTGEIYRNSTENLFIDNNIVNRWCAVVPGVASSCVDNDYFDMVFNSELECETTLEEYANSGELDETMQYLVENATCEPGTLTYETTPVNISQNNYLKHEVVNNVVTASYACITYTEDGIRKDVCLRGGDSTYFESNTSIVRSVESYFNTLDYSGSSTGKGYCYFNESNSGCYSGSLDLYAYSGGYVYARGGSASCSVSSDGYSRCDES